MHEMLTEVRDASERAAGLTRQLLAFSRRQLLEPIVLDLNEALIRIEKLLRRIIGEDIALVNSLDPDIERVRIDPGQIEQVVMNLAVNARDAMPDGGQLSIETRNVTIAEGPKRDPAACPPGRYIRVRIADSGTGIAPDIQARIFEPFFTTKGPGRGTGLGLATVYGIVQQSGGHIAVASTLGAGTTFDIHLPAVATAAEMRAESVRVVPTGHETILVVEDEDVVRRVVRRILERLGYRVVEASNGARALAMLDGGVGPIDLVITDVVMPEMSGPRFVEALRASRPDVRVLFMSGYPEGAMIGQSSLAHEDYLHKPLTPEGMARKVRAVLDK